MCTGVKSTNETQPKVKSVVTTVNNYTQNELLHGSSLPTHGGPVHKPPSIPPPKEPVPGRKITGMGSHQQDPEADLILNKPEEFIKLRATYKAKIESMAFYRADAAPFAKTIIALCNWAVCYCGLHWKYPVLELPEFLFGEYHRSSKVQHQIPSSPPDKLMQHSDGHIRSQTHWNYLRTLLQFFTDETYASFAAVGWNLVLYGGHQRVPSTLVQYTIYEVNRVLEDTQVTWPSILAPTLWLAARICFNSDEELVYNQQKVPDVSSTQIETETLELWIA